MFCFSSTFVCCSSTLAITLSATAGPVRFGDTKEGTFGLRVPTSMDVDAGKGGRIINSEGLSDTKAWGQPAAWVDRVVLHTGDAEAGRIAERFQEYATQTPAKLEGRAAK